MCRVACVAAWLKNNKQLNTHERWLLHGCGAWFDLLRSSDFGKSTELRSYPLHSARRNGATRGSCDAHAYTSWRRRRYTSRWGQAHFYVAYWDDSRGEETFGQRSTAPESTGRSYDLGTERACQAIDGGPAIAEPVDRVHGRGDH